MILSLNELTIQIHKPSTKPRSDGPKYQEYWAANKSPNSAENIGVNNSEVEV